MLVLNTKTHLFVIVSCLLLLMSYSAYAQDISKMGFAIPQEEKSYDLFLKSGTQLLEKKANFERISTLDQVEFDGKKYLILQFNNTPNQDKRAELSACGIELLEYIPNYAYWASVPKQVDGNTLENIGVRAVLVPAPADKISPDLLKKDLPAHAIKKEGTIDIVLYIHDNVEAIAFQNRLQKLPIEILEKTDRNVKVRVAPKELKALAGQPFIKFIMPIEEKVEQLGAARSIAVRGEYLNSPVNGGLKGNGVELGLNDLGTPGHIDVLARIVDSDYAYNDSNHANACAGVMLGAGILAPSGQGVATEASLNIIGNLNDTYIAQHPDMVLTSTVLGGGLGGDYTTASINFDNQMINNSHLLHTVSAGNSGLLGYNSVVDGWQAAKNVLTVGAGTYYNEIWEKSSLGPVADGRLKPEITAIGFQMYLPVQNNGYGYVGGTSFSAPQTAGGLALLYEHWRNLNNGENPTGALMKAIVCNTADDLGNPGPDFTNGYGKLNLRRAKKAIDDGLFVTASLGDSEYNFNYGVIVPNDIQQLRVMLYWSDPAASLNASKALVNDLNMIIDGPDGTDHFPYLLDPNNPAAPATKAGPGVYESTNNMEQIVIDNPLPGNYQMVIWNNMIAQAVGDGSNHIIGSGMNDGAFFQNSLGQEFHIVCEFVEKGITLISPLDGETIKGAGPNYYIQWDYYGDDNNTFTIEYSFDNGTNWTLLDDAVDGDARIYQWQPQYLSNVNTNEALVRISRNNTSYTDENEAPFKVLDMVNSNISISTHCQDVLEVSWNATIGADAYEVLVYNGVDAMEVVGNTSCTSLLVPYDFSKGEGWFAVQAIYNGDRSMRSNAKKFTPPATSGLCPFIGQTGKVSRSQPDANTWFTVKLNRDYIDPIVVMGSPTYNDSEPLTVRVKNITSNSFDYQLDEWDYLDGVHGEETVSYMVVEAGQYLLDNGQLLVAGKSSAVTHVYTTQAFGTTFSDVPTVFSQTTTVNKAAAVTTRQKNVSTTQFQLAIQEQELTVQQQQLGGGRNGETVCWIAIGQGAGSDFEVGNTPDAIRHLWRNTAPDGSYCPEPVVLANLQTRDGGDAVALRYRNLSNGNIQLMCEEEQSRDSEISHTTEVAGYYIGKAGFISGTTFTQRIITEPLAQEEAFNINVYPNPVSDKVTIDIASDMDLTGQTFQIRLFDLSGKELINMEKILPADMQLVLSLGHFPTGMYVLRLDNLETNTYFTQKITKG